MRKKMTAVLLAGTFMLSLLAGCGTKTGATDQASENSNIVEAGGAEDAEKETEDTGSSVAAEDENIVLYAERGRQEYVPLSESVYYENVNTFTSEEDMPLYDGDGYYIGYVKANSSIVATESAEDIAWSRFENPLSGTEYDYLYILNDFMVDLTKLYFDTESMKQGIIDYINTYWLADIDYNFVDEKTSDMEMIEFNMECVYDDNIEFWYWLAEGFRETTSISSYETLYVECEDDVDGWITCRIYYKDYVEVNQY